MNIFKAACLSAALTALSSTLANAAPAPIEVIHKFDETLLNVMKDASKLGVTGRYQKLDGPIRTAFNIPFMTRIVVGSQWSTWTKQQQDAVSAAFAKLITSTYAVRFDGYSGESFVEDSSKPLSTGVLVNTRLVRLHDEPVALNYVMRQNADLSLADC